MDKSSRLSHATEHEFTAPLKSWEVQQPEVDPSRETSHEAAFDEKGIIRRLKQSSMSDMGKTGPAISSLMPRVSLDVF
jgi:hypothetical protein